MYLNMTESLRDGEYVLVSHADEVDAALNRLQAADPP